MPLFGLSREDFPLESSGSQVRLETVPCSSWSWTPSCSWFWSPTPLSPSSLSGPLCGAVPSLSTTEGPGCFPGGFSRVPDILVPLVLSETQGLMGPLLSLLVSPTLPPAVKMMLAKQNSLAAGSGPPPGQRGQRGLTLNLSSLEPILTSCGTVLSLLPPHPPHQLTTGCWKFIPCGCVWLGL